MRGEIVTFSFSYFMMIVYRTSRISCCMRASLSPSLSSELSGDSLRRILWLSLMMHESSRSSSFSSQGVDVDYDWLKSEPNHRCRRWCRTWEQKEKSQVKSLSELRKSSYGISWAVHFFILVNERISNVLLLIIIIVMVIMMLRCRHKCFRQYLHVWLASSSGKRSPPWFLMLSSFVFWCHGDVNVSCCSCESWCDGMRGEKKKRWEEKSKDLMQWWSNDLMDFRGWD